MNLLLVPYWADHKLKDIQWPPFLLASKVNHVEPSFARNIFLYADDLLLMSCKCLLIDSYCTGHGEGQQWEGS